MKARICLQIQELTTIPDQRTAVSPPEMYRCVQFLQIGVDFYILQDTDFLMLR